MDPAQLAVRLAQFQKERDLAATFDHTVINRSGELEKAIADCREIVDNVMNSRLHVIFECVACAFVSNFVCLIRSAKRRRVREPGTRPQPLSCSNFSLLGSDGVAVKGRAVVASAAGGGLQLVEKEYAAVPPAGHVRVRVRACGVCHSDSLTVMGHLGNSFPRVPGHEVAGVVDAVGPGVQRLQKGQRVGLGWHGGHCNVCPACLRGDFILCATHQVSGGSFDGGYADYLVCPENALALIPDELKDVEAAPLLCAGITTFNSLRNSGAKPGDVVAVVGVGGLGHLAVQYAVKSGYKTVAIARGQDKAALVQQLGAHVYIDSTATPDVAKELQKLGGAQVILSTVTNADAVEAVFGGLAPNGKLMINGVLDRPLSLNTLAMISGRRSVQGWPSGCAKDSEDTMQFSALTGIRPMIETFPLDKAAEGYERMMSGKARFRVVLTME